MQFYVSSQALVQEVESYGSTVANTVDLAQQLDNDEAKAKVLQLNEEYISLTNSAKVKSQ
jgi:hypothetical protein